MPFQPTKVIIIRIDVLFTVRINLRVINDTLATPDYLNYLDGEEPLKPLAMSTGGRFYKSKSDRILRHHLSLDKIAKEGSGMK